MFDAGAAPGFALPRWPKTTGRLVAWHGDMPLAALLSNIWGPPPFGAPAPPVWVLREVVYVCGADEK